jgi:hypothetical protein
MIASPFLCRAWRQELESEPQSVCDMAACEEGAICPYARSKVQVKKMVEEVW